MGRKQLARTGVAGDTERTLVAKSRSASGSARGSPEGVLVIWHRIQSSRPTSARTIAGRNLACDKTEKGNGTKTTAPAVGGGQRVTGRFRVGEYYRGHRRWLLVYDACLTSPDGCYAVHCTRYSKGLREGVKRTYNIIPLYAIRKEQMHQICPQYLRVSRAPASRPIGI